MRRGVILVTGVGLVVIAAAQAGAQEQRPGERVRPAQVRPERVRAPVRPLRAATVSYVNLSELHFRPTALATRPSGPDPEAGEEAAARGDPDYAPPPQTPRRFAPSGKGLLWNTAVGRSAFGDRLQLGGAATPTLRPEIRPLRPVDPDPRPRVRPRSSSGGGGPNWGAARDRAAACVQPTVSLTDPGVSTARRCGSATAVSPTC